MTTRVPLNHIMDAIVQDVSAGVYNTAKANLWQMVIPLCPNVAFYVQEFQLPSISAPAPKVATPFVNYPVGSDKAEFSPLTVTFVVDGGYNNYAQAVKWLYGISRVTDADNMRAFLDQVDSPMVNSEQDLHCDIEVIMTTQSGSELRRVVFKDAIITGLSGTNHTTTNGDVPQLTSTATFDYSHYEFL